MLSELEWLVPAFPLNLRSDVNDEVMVALPAGTVSNNHCPGFPCHVDKTIFFQGSLMFRLCSITLLLTLTFFAAETPLVAQAFDERYSDWPVDLKIDGEVSICGGSLTADQVVELLDGDQSKPATTIICCQPDAVQRAQEIASSIKEKCQSVETISWEDDSFSTPLNLVSSNVLILIGTANAKAGKALVAASATFSQIIQSEGRILAEGSLAPLLGRVTPDSIQSTERGLNLVPDAIVTLENDDSTAETRILTQLKKHPRTVSLQIGKDTWLVFRGRKMWLREGGTATVLIPASNQLPEQKQTISKAANRREMAANLIDWTQWRRMSTERTLEPFPPANPPKPNLENGTLIIVGGGGMPDGILKRFVKLAGGDQAELVYIPCSERDDVGGEPGIVRAWKRQGVASATYLHTKNREQANSDPEFLQPLKTATGLMFGGGRQWNFSDSYYGTQAHELMKQVLQRGGVVIGSSAGASIQARYLARATPIGNTEIMAPGYERGGLGFISGVAIDQHFSQRRRQRDLSQLVNQYPQLLGIGIDETTAIVVQGSRAEVVGQGRVFFYDRDQRAADSDPDFIALPAGSVFDLAKREVLVDTRK